MARSIDIIPLVDVCFQLAAANHVFSLLGYGSAAAKQHNFTRKIIHLAEYSLLFVLDKPFLLRRYLLHID